MATAEYRLWNSRGRPYSVALPIAQFVSQARAAGVTVLGVIGNEAHLTADFPEDHTPFTRTAWPNALVGYIVTACDLADGPWSDRILAACKSGDLPQVKYLNFRGQHFNVKNGWKPTRSSDKHLHISVRTDRLKTPLAFNAFTSAPPAPAPTRKGDTVGFLARTAADPTVYFGDGFRSHTIATMAQAADYESAGAVWKTYPDTASMFAVIGPPAAAQLDRIEAALKTPAAVSLTSDQLVYLGGYVVRGILEAVRSLITGATK